MALVDATYLTALQAAILAALQAQFPINTSLLTAEKSAMATAQSNFATALATGIAAPTDTQIKTGVVSITGTVISGAGAPGNIIGTGAVA